MAILANRVKTKNHLLEIVKFIFFAVKKFSIVVLIFACTYLLYFPVSGISKPSLEISGMVLSAGTSISNAVIGNLSRFYDRLSYFKNLEAENINLKLQLTELSKIKLLAANTLSENKELRKLLLVTQSLEYKTIASRLIGVNLTPLSSSAMIEAGNNHDVNIDDLVTNQDGLIGRVVSTSNNYSSIMLLTDPNSRVPVVTLSSKERGILARQGDHMQLIYLPQDHKVEVGELICTSGDGKIYPYGLLVGQVYKIVNDSIFIKLNANLNNTEFVNIELKSQKLNVGL